MFEFAGNKVSVWLGERVEQEKPQQEQADLPWNERKFSDLESVMCKEDDQRSVGSDHGQENAQTRVLAVSDKRADELSSRLQLVLAQAHNVQVLRSGLAHATQDNCSWLMSDAIAAFAPQILVLCLSSPAISIAGTIVHGIRQTRADLPIFLVVEHASPQELERVLCLGITDFALPPLRSEDLVPRLKRCRCWASEMHWAVCALKEKLGLERFIGESDVFVRAIQVLPKLARCDASVFILGETGTGKEMFAHALHYLGPRCHRTFIAVNCGAIPSELMENEFFGHEAGAFTGAAAATRGLVSEAEGGTLFLDEIDSLPLPMQVKLLRLLQEKEYRPLGARKACKADLRVIAASNASLQDSVRGGRFRADLFYRLNILPLSLPALRDRREDIPLLARHFVSKYSQEFSIPMKQLSPAAIDKLTFYEWPGNVRELENIIERALVLSEEPIIKPEDIVLPAAAPADDEPSFKTMKSRVIADFETTYIRRLLSAHHGNISKAALAAKKDRRAFWQLMRKHHLTALRLAPAH